MFVFISTLGFVCYLCMYCNSDSTRYTHTYFTISNLLYTTMYILYTMLYYTILYYTIYYAILYYIILYYILILTLSY